MAPCGGARCSDSNRVSNDALCDRVLPRADLQYSRFIFSVMDFMWSSRPSACGCSAVDLREDRVRTGNRTSDPGLPVPSSFLYVHNLACVLQLIGEETSWLR